MVERCPDKTEADGPIPSTPTRPRSKPRYPSTPKHLYPMNNNPGNLYIVSTPIGNLGDISNRAIETLKNVGLIACEDTRVSQKLLKHFDIKNKLISLHEHSNKNVIDKIISIMNDGTDVAYISDAGTPGISDPGYMLVKEVNEKFGGEFIKSIPGPSAVTSALSISPVRVDKFTFIGFLPHKKGRQTELKEAISREEATILFESTHRILKLMKEIDMLAPERTIIVFKELTKMHEQFFFGKASEITKKLESDKGLVKGEFVVFIC